MLELCKSENIYYTCNVFRFPIFASVRCKEHFEHFYKITNTMKMGFIEVSMLILFPAEWHPDSMSLFKSCKIKQHEGLHGY